MNKVLVEQSKNKLRTLGRMPSSKQAIEIRLEHLSRAINELAIIVLEMSVTIERQLVGK